MFFCSRFSKHRPSGPMLPISRNVRLSVRVFVRLRDERILKNWLERIFEYIWKYVTCSNEYLNIQWFLSWIFKYSNICVLKFYLPKYDMWHRKPDMCQTGMWTLSQNFRSLALMVWEFKDSNQKDDRLNQSISNGTRCRAMFRAGAFTVAPVSASNQPRGHGLRQQSLRR